MNTKIYNAIIEKLRELISGTEWEGHVFAVGGCVRDSYLGNPIKDVDLAIDLPMGSIRFAEWLHKNRLTAGKPIYFVKFGTSKLRLGGFGNVELEIVQTRKGKYDAGTVNCPETVFGSILDDARRRDLTINSLYYDITNRKLLDPLGTGIADLDARRLNTPLRPSDTFEDDPVRMLRVLRFHSRLGWELKPEIYEAMRPYVKGLAEISAPRLGGEFFKALAEKKTLETLDAFKDLGIFDYVAPLLGKQFQLDPSAWDRIRRMTEIYESQANPDPALMLAILLQEVGLSMMPKPDEERERLGIGLSHLSSRVAKDMVKVMKVDRSVSNDVAFFISNMHRLRNAGPDGSGFRDRLLHGLINAAGSKERLERLLRLIDIYNKATDPSLAGQVPNIGRRIQEIIQREGFPEVKTGKSGNNRRKSPEKQESRNSAKQQKKKKSRRKWRPRRYGKNNNK